MGYEWDMYGISMGYVWDMYSKLRRPCGFWVNFLVSRRCFTMFPKSFDWVVAPEKISIECVSNPWPETQLFV